MKIRILILAAILATVAMGQDGFSVVVQKDNPTTSISKALLRKMIMGEGSWPGGGKVVVLIGPVGDAARTAALKQICGMSEPDFAKHVLQVKFEGGNKTVPKTNASAAALLSLLQTTPGALGIVQAADVGEGTKILPVE